VKLLVCGGRDFSDAKLLDRFMSYADNSDRGPITTIIHGGAAGADTMAGEWGKKHHIQVSVYRADWSRYGRSAGPRRNEQMLNEGKPDMVLAFPGGRGTAHMVTIAKKAGVRVVYAR
jgi:hypothetical protein